MSSRSNTLIWLTFLWMTCPAAMLQAAAANAMINAPEVAVASGEEESGPEHGKINTADATPVDPGHVEIEPAASFSHSRHYWDNEKNSHARGLARERSIQLSLTAGIVEDVDVNVSGGYSWIKDNDNDFDTDDGVQGPTTGHGFKDLELSGRYRFYTSKDHQLDLAYSAGVTLPTGSDASGEKIGISQEFWSFNQMVAASKDWGKWTANADVGYALPVGDKRGYARGTLRSDVALGYQLRPWLQPEVELNYCYDVFKDADDAQLLAVTAGLVMPVNERLRVNIGVQQDVWGQNNDKATTLLTAVKLAF